MEVDAWPRTPQVDEPPAPPEEPADTLETMLQKLVERSHQNSHSQEQLRAHLDILEDYMDQHVFQTITALQDENRKMEKELTYMRKIVNQSDYRLYVLEWQMALWRREHIKQPFIVDLGGTADDGGPGNFSANESLPLLGPEPEWWSFSTVYMIFLSILLLLNLIVTYRNSGPGSDSRSSDGSIKKQEKNQVKR